MLGIYTAAGVSGAHLNPGGDGGAGGASRVSRGARCCRMRWRRSAGAFAASALVFATYREALHGVRRRHCAWSRAPRRPPASSPPIRSRILSMAGGFVDQVVGTMLLMAGRAGGHRPEERRRRRPGLTAPLVAVLVVAIGVAFGFNAGYAINPARDLGPRLFTAVAGWGPGVFTAGRRLVVGADRGALRRRDSGRVALRRLRQQASRRAGGRPMSHYILALDQGTTSSRAIVFDRRARPWRRRSRSSRRSSRARATSSTIPRRSGRRSWQIAREALASAPASPPPTSPPSASPTSARRPSSGSGPPAGRSPTPSSGRAASRAPICERLEGRRARADVPREDRPGGRCLFLRHEDQAPARYVRRPARPGRDAARSSSAPSIRSSSGGSPAASVHVTDVSNASRTLLFNIHTLEWDDELLRLLDVPRAMLPEVRSSSEVYGETRCRAASAAPIPIAGDRRRPAGGHVRPGLLRAGQRQEHLRHRLLHAAQHRRHSRCRRENNLLTTVGWQIGGETTYCLEGSVFVAGAVVQWLRDGLGSSRRRPTSKQLAASVPRHRRRVSRAGLRRPRRAVLGSVRPRRDRRHHARTPRRRTSPGRRSSRWPFRPATCSRRCRRTRACRWPTLKVDGGAAVNDALMQFQADLLGVHRPAAGRRRDHRPRRGLPGRPGRRLLEGPGRRGAQLGARSRVPPGDGRRRARDASTPGWKKAVERARSTGKTDHVRATETRRHGEESEHLKMPAAV